MARPKKKKELDIDYTEYPRKVLSGEIVAGEYVRLSCQRFLDWMEREDIEFRKDKVDHVVNFISKIKHYRGGNAGQHFHLEPFQQWLTAGIFGFYWKGTDKRVVRNVWIELSRKNGKTALAVAYALYGLIADGEQGSEVDFVANTRKQAGIAFEMAHTTAKQLDPTGKILKRYRDQIKFPYTNSVLQVLSSDSNSNDGFNSHITVCDEVHAYGVDSSGSNGMVQVMRSSQGNRTNPLMIYITTAGFNLYGFAFPFRSTILEVLKGKKKDDTLFAAIYCLDAEDDYTDENVWIKANPNLDVTCSRDYLKQQVEQAKNMVSFEISTRTKNFNEWLSMSDVDAWIDQASLINVTRKWDYNMFNGREVFAYMGLDLSAVSDLTALSTMVEFDNKMWFKVEYFLPEDALKKGPNAEQYKEWHRLGFLNVTDGNVVNYDAVAKKISDINQSMPISMVAYDKWNSIPFLSTFQNMGLPMQPYSQSIGNFSIASKELERRIKRGEVILDDNPITRWCYDNVILKTDWNDNIKPIKSNKSSEKKIDGVIAMIQSLGGWLATNHYGAEIFVV